MPRSSVESDACVCVSVSETHVNDDWFRLKGTHTHKGNCCIQQPVFTIYISILLLHFADVLVDIIVGFVHFLILFFFAMLIIYLYEPFIRSFFLVVVVILLAHDACHSGRVSSASILHKSMFHVSLFVYACERQKWLEQSKQEIIPVDWRVNIPYRPEPHYASSIPLLESRIIARRRHQARAAIFYRARSQHTIYCRIP